MTLLKVGIVPSNWETKKARLESSDDGLLHSVAWFRSFSIIFLSK